MPASGRISAAPRPAGGQGRLGRESRHRGFRRWPPFGQSGRQVRGDRCLPDSSLDRTHGEDVSDGGHGLEFDPCSGPMVDRRNAATPRSSPAVSIRSRSSTSAGALLVLVSVNFVWLQLVPIGNICPFCMMSAGATVGLFGLALSILQMS